jgi:hypothetical protein
MHSMHGMHRGRRKSGGLEYAIILGGLKDMFLIKRLLWEQEVVPLNSGIAPTSLRFIATTRRLIFRDEILLHLHLAV